MSRGLGDVYKRQVHTRFKKQPIPSSFYDPLNLNKFCLLYTSPSPRDMRRSRMPSSA
ncbi:hypothetical protein JMUB7533_26780 [Staphylococcus aureus]